MAYNLILSIALRDSSHLYYSLHIVGTGLVLICLYGFAFAYFWSDSPWLANVAVPISISLALLSVQLFARDFLGLRDR